MCSDPRKNAIIRISAPGPSDVENSMNRFSIGRRIEAYRDRAKMSTQELAGRIKRSQATISRIENGKQGVSFELLACIAAELRVHPFALLSDDPPQIPGLIPARERSGDGDDAPDAAKDADFRGKMLRIVETNTGGALEHNRLQ